MAKIIHSLIFLYNIGVIQTFYTDVHIVIGDICSQSQEDDLPMMSFTLPMSLYSKKHFHTKSKLFCVSFE